MKLVMAVNSRYPNSSLVSHSRKNNLSSKSKFDTTQNTHNPRVWLASSQALPNNKIGIMMHAMRSDIYPTPLDTHSWPSHHAICFDTELMLEIATA